MSRKKMFIAGFMLMFLLLVGSTMAYLTDMDSKTNVFTFGNVDVEISEPHWVPADGLNIIPGQTLPKDPKVTNTGSTNAYVFMKTSIPCVNNKPVFTFTLNSGWTVMWDADSTICQGDTAYGVFAYGTSTTMTPLAPNASTPTLFDSVTVASLNNSEVDQLPDELEITVITEAVQADGDNTGHGHSSDPIEVSYALHPVA